MLWLQWTSAHRRHHIEIHILHKSFVYSDTAATQYFTSTDVTMPISNWLNSTACNSTFLEESHVEEHG